MEYTKKELEEIMRKNGGWLDFRYTGITALPDNLTVGGCLDLRDTKITSLPDNLTVGSDLYLSGTGITELPENLTVGGWLDLSYTKITSLPDNLIVGGNLYLSGTGITELPENLTVGGGLYFSYTGITALPENLTVGGDLHLNGTGITALPDNLTVGGWLDLRDTKITSLPDNLTVGSDLYLNGTGIAALPDNLTVGGLLYLSDTGITDTIQVKRLENGDYVDGRYLYADNILTHIALKKRVGDYVFYLGKIKGKNIVQKGNLYAHCDKFKDGVTDLVFKELEERGTEQYDNLTIDSEISYDEAVSMYRIITGACRQGTHQWLDNLPKEKIKEKYKISEIIELTNGEYGADRFKQFFQKEGKRWKQFCGQSINPTRII